MEEKGRGKKTLLQGTEMHGVTRTNISPLFPLRWRCQC